MQVFSVERPEVAPLTMPARFRTDVAYFMTPADEPGAPQLGEHEYWIRRQDAQRWLDDGFVAVISPLAADAKAEIELTEEQEALLEWLLANETQHIRLA